MKTAPVIAAVMAGLAPAIHVLLFRTKDVDARVKPAHDDFNVIGKYARAGATIWRRQARMMLRAPSIYGLIDRAPGSGASPCNW
jgi:hypothetical protein